MTTSIPMTVVLVTYNRRESLLRTLAKLTALPEQPHILVVDNCSTDGTVARVMVDALSDMSHILRERTVVPAHVATQLRKLQHGSSVSEREATASVSVQYP